MYHTCVRQQRQHEANGDIKTIKDRSTNSERCKECDHVTARIMSEGEIREAMGVLRDRLRIMQMMVDDCADMFQQKKIKKWKEARRRTRFTNTHFELDWNIIGCVFVTLVCYVIRCIARIFSGSAEEMDPGPEDPVPVDSINS